MHRGIVEPHLRLCCAVWGHCGLTTLETLQKLHNRAARIVAKSRHDTPAVALIHILSWLIVSDITRSKTAKCEITNFELQIKHIYIYFINFFCMLTGNVQLDLSYWICQNITWNVSKYEV